MSKVLAVRPLNFSLTLSLTVALLMGFCSLRPCAAQGLVPVIQLSDDEAGKAKQLADSVKSAQNRNSKAQAAWEQFHQNYQMAHPNLAPVRFTADFRHAFALRGSPSLLESKPVRTIDLTTEEQQKLQALHQEIVDSDRGVKDAETTLRDYGYQLVAAHVAARGEPGTVMRLGGKQVTIPMPWEEGLAFTPDYRLAVPRRQSSD
jgi:hypothetical protein